MCCCMARAVNYFQWCSGVTPPYAIPLSRSQFVPPRRICIECSGRIAWLRNLLRLEGTPRLAAPLPWLRSLCREWKFQCFRRTLDAGRVHTTGLLSTLPAQGVPTQELITLSRAYFRGILVFECILKCTIMCYWDVDLSVMWRPLQALVK